MSLSEQQREWAERELLPRVTLEEVLKGELVGLSDEEFDQLYDRD